MRERPTPVQRSRWQAIGQAAGIGFGIAAALILPIVGGLVLDGRLGRAPLFTLIGVAVGLVAAGYQLVELTKAANRVPVDPVAVEAARRRRADEAEAQRRFLAQVEARAQADLDAGNRGPERAPRRDEE
ncbi:MAG: hypothetical protein AVDCRST_MAG59-3960 [uncultured Thermomicrobiales bacterium]|uniref:ATP synthase protein I n=1 Tax=uncultured Thermomicrobiales bacterium TaxID=1645740 RepID=A0A6J4VE39_9BACT|nr:MAG: hypothetical protein AVDCRST_MAG59-3960 [uncultured Thermomicrobiales bacterium]